MSQNYNPGYPDCTAVKIGPRSALTAAHCIHKEINGQWYVTTSGYFHPGSTRTDYLYQVDREVPWSGVSLRDHRQGRQWDYAVLYLNDIQELSNLGWLGIQWSTGASWYNGKSVYGSGYPGRYQNCADSPYSNDDCGGWQYRDLDTLSSSDFGTSSNNHPYQLGHQMMTSSGQSGMPIYRTTSSESVLGVYWGYYTSDITTNQRRWAARFRSSMYNDVCNWIAAAPSQYRTHQICN